ncbi:hypothetical protein [Candidatus Aquiluna sp. UB-MaderosW2red]|uniref:hypothetical protein n=1 Tax=Candidatus Aquiluna sp. UB-MaderosW2red TaxID=1855377 RepID=UPI000875E45D|nr:hypothetical protein [Candidatus Aquiluna sp. UB-MaderosW2red]SCX07730.1 hypothetical protein SAMN05216534_0666 [Candidatus Aquiluna sp. UB-MaderosW2red]
MIRIPRISAIILALGFGLYHATLGLINLPKYEHPGFAAVAIGIYVFALVNSLLQGPGFSLRLGSALTNLAAAIFVPLLMSVALDPEAIAGFNTWHVAAIGTLMAITAIRQQRLIAWVGLGFVILQVLVWGGLDIIFNSGVIGALFLVAASQAAASGLRASALAARQYREQAIATSEATYASSAARAERKLRVSKALDDAQPLLERIIAKQGNLSEAEQTDARLTEAALRDQIRGRSMVTEELVLEVRKARARGVEVQLLDDGGFLDISEAEKAELIDRVVRELSLIKSGKVVIRAVAGQDWRLTMAALRKEAEKPDLFLRL